MATAFLSHSIGHDRLCLFELGRLDSAWLPGSASTAVCLGDRSCRNLTGPLEAVLLLLVRLLRRNSNACRTRAAEQWRGGASNLSGAIIVTCENEPRRTHWGCPCASRVSSSHDITCIKDACSSFSCCGQQQTNQKAQTKHSTCCSTHQIQPQLRCGPVLSSEGF